MQFGTDKDSVLLKNKMIETQKGHIAEISNMLTTFKPQRLIKSGQWRFVIQLFVDNIAIITAYLLFFFIRFGSGIYPAAVKPGALEITLGTFIFLSFWLLMCFFSGMYKNWYERSPFEEFWSIIKVTLIGCVIIIFAVKIDSQSSPRQLFLIYFVLHSTLMISGRVTARFIERYMRIKGLLSIPVVIVGDYEKVINYFKKFRRVKTWGYQPLAVLLISRDELKEKSGDIVIESGTYLGTVDQLGDVLRHTKPEEVVIATEKPDHKLLVDIVNQCADEKVRVKIEPDLYDVFAGQTKTYYLYGLPLIEVSTQLLKPWQEAIKRIFDFTFSFLVLLAGLPFWVLIALGVKIDSKGPIFYTQKRVGKDGRIFEIYKFRSMVFQPERQDQTWTTMNDPRVTTFGRFIRKTHLDEIPQFLNVLLGHMSIVGPRPEQPKFVDDFTKDFPHYKRRLKVRPGITGWHQVTSYGYELSAEEIRDRLRNDFHYIENMSLKLDIEIIVRTLWCMIMGRGQA